MATSSITKEFVLKDDKACDVLINVLNTPSKRKKKPHLGQYEEGKKLLEKYSSHSRNS